MDDPSRDWLRLHPRGGMVLEPPPCNRGRVRKIKGKRTNRRHALPPVRVLEPSKYGEKDCVVPWVESWPDRWLLLTGVRPNVERVEQRGLTGAQHKFKEQR